MKPSCCLDHTHWHEGFEDLQRRHAASLEEAQERFARMAWLLAEARILAAEYRDEVTFEHGVQPKNEPLPWERALEGSR